MHKNCKKHGYFEFTLKKSKKKEWWVCNLCLKEQWKKSSLKYRKQPNNKEYYRNKSKEIIESRHLLAGLLILLTYILPPD